MTLVEKMAWAMYGAMAEVIERAYAEQHEPAPGEYFPVVIEVLKAMRSPDDEEGGRIETAGMFALPFDHVHDGEPYKQANSALLCWQAMIDQAIKEGE